MSCCIPGWKRVQFQVYILHVLHILCVKWFTPHSPQCIQQSLHAVWRLLFQHLNAALHLQHTHACMWKYSFKRKVTPFCPSPLTVITTLYKKYRFETTCEYWVHGWTTVREQFNDIKFSKYEAVESACRHFNQT